MFFLNKAWKCSKNYASKNVLLINLQFPQKQSGDFLDDPCRMIKYVLRRSSKKYPDWLKLTYFPLSVIHEILAPDVFDDADSESENWHRAKKIREVLMDY